jgi:hypothetical protein
MRRDILWNLINWRFSDGRMAAFDRDEILNGAFLSHAVFVVNRDGDKLSLEFAGEEFTFESRWSSIRRIISSR